MKFLLSPLLFVVSVNAQATVSERNLYGHSSSVSGYQPYGPGGCCVLVCPATPKDPPFVPQPPPPVSTPVRGTAPPVSFPSGKSGKSGMSSRSSSGSSSGKSGMSGSRRELGYGGYRNPGHFECYYDCSACHVPTEPERPDNSFIVPGDNESCYHTSTNTNSEFCACGCRCCLDDYVEVPNPQVECPCPAPPTFPPSGKSGMMSGKGKSGMGKSGMGKSGMDKSGMGKSGMGKKRRELRNPYDEDGDISFPVVYQPEDPEVCFCDADPEFDIVPTFVCDCGCDCIDPPAPEPIQPTPKPPTRPPTTPETEPPVSSPSGKAGKSGKSGMMSGSSSSSSSSGKVCLH